ncbi:MAG: site-specific integrase [Olegusella sp.]|nr:site-specific integrase [Olegusella sp.]
MTDIACYAEGNRGQKTALAELASWRDEVINDLKRQEERAERMGSAISATGVDPSKVTVSQYVYTFIKQRADAGAIEESTRRSYNDSWKHIDKRLADVTLEKLNPQMVRDMESSMTESGYSSSTVGKVHRLLKEAMSQAINDDLLTKDPTRGCKPPKRVNKNPNAYSAEDAAIVMGKLNDLPNSSCTVAAKLALYCGLRRGEIAALRWSDVTIQHDPETKAPAGGNLVIGRSIGVAEHGTYIKSAKTDRVRDVPIPAPMAQCLVSWRGQCAQEAMALGVSDVSNYYVVGHIDGTYCDPIVLSRQWTELAKLIGIKGTTGTVPTLHHLRHTYATRAITEGVDVRTVSSVLGHANVAMTLNVYASADPAAKRAAAQVMSDAYAKKPSAEVIPMKKVVNE